MRRPINSMISRALTSALLLVVMMAGCKEDEGGVVDVCDTTLPLASAISPACGATGVALNQKITATFNEAMDSSTVTTATFTLAGPGGIAVPGTVAFVSTTNIATFTPSSLLSTGTTYTYTLKGGANGVKDRSGNELAYNFACSFTTGATADVTPPTVISTNPANNAAGVPLSKVTSAKSSKAVTGAALKKKTGTSVTAGMASGRIITATFSEAMDPLTISSSTFTVTGPGGTAVTGSVSYGGTSFTGMFVSTANLAPNATYTGTITTGAKDLAGNALASTYVWTFTTGAATDITPPTVISTDPDNNATGVALNKKIAATFSEPMDTSKLNATTFRLQAGSTSILGTITYAGTTALFSPAANLAANTLYTATITVGARDLLGNTLTSDYVWNFTTGAAPDVTPPTVTSTDPANNATGVALNKKIAASFSEAMDPTTISTTSFTLKQGTTAISGTVAYAGTTVIFTPASVLASNTVYTATMSTGAKDLAGNALASSYVWSFTTATAADLTPPSVISTDPANNASGVLLTKVITAVFSEGMDQSTLTAATVTLSGLGGASVTGAVTYVNSTKTLTFTPASSLAANTTYTGRIRGGVGGAEDLAGNALASTYAWTFTTGAAIDATPPTVLSTDPINAATGVALNKKIAVNFSEAMNQSTLNATTFTLQSGTTSITGTLSFAGTTVVFTPTSALAPNVAYVATITTGAKDLAGNAMANNYAWTFTTGAAADATPPTVISTDPANNATGVPLSKVSTNAALSKKAGTKTTAVGKIITATFSEAMDPLTITASTFTIAGPGLSPVTGLVTYAGTSFTATFIAASSLAPNTTYTGTITTGSKDLAGNALASNYVWTFTTGATPDLTAPTVVFTDPENGVTGVAFNKKIAATFSEAMRSSTITSSTFTLKQGTTSVTGAIAYAGMVAIFTPASNLAPNTTYTATITTGAKDSAGNGLASNYIWNFTTGVAADINPPVVISTDPANNATGVAINKKILVEFSEVMDVLTLTTTTFTLKQGTTSMNGTVTYSGTGATFAPSGNLAANTVYTATITTGARDLAGNAMASNYVWSFTTSAAPDVTPPIVLYTFPLDNTSGINLGRTITATFSEAMDPLTINAATYTLTKTGGETITGKVTYSGTTANFNPILTLTTNAIYTATITTGARDLAGNAMAQNYVWSFSGIALPTKYMVVTSSDPLAGGTTTGGGSFNAGAGATVIATPNAGYTFTNWTEGVSIVSTDPTYTFTVFGNRTLVANFTAIPYTVALSSNPAAGGTTGGSGTFNSGSSVTVTATPNAGYTFTNWTEGATVVSANASYTFTISGNRTLVANFTTIPYTVTLSSNPAAGGTTGGGGIYGSGSSVTVTATPNVGYAFTNWTEGLTVVSSSASYTFTVSGNRILVANFTAIPYTVTLSSNPLPGGTTSGDGTYSSGSSVTVTATPNVGYTFTSWTEGVVIVSASASYTFTISGNRTLVANFAVAGPPPIAPVNLLSTANFVILAGSMVTNVPTSDITGDVGLSPAAGSNYAGLTQPEVAGTIYTVNAAGPAGYVIDVARLTAAKGDLTIAYNDAAGRTPVPAGPFLNPGGGNIGGLTLVAGLYKFTGSAQITGSDVVLSGSATDVWIFQIASNFNVGNGIKVILGGTAQAKNIFWQVGTSATLGTTSVVEGTILADQLISLATGATLHGRALTFTGAVTLDKATLVRPPL